MLIFSDVVASGSLVNDLATVVHHLGGEVKAVLCVVLAGKEFTDQLPLKPHQSRESPPKIVLQLGSVPLDSDPIPPLSADGTAIVDAGDISTLEVPLFSLTDRELTNLGPQDYSESQIIPIDLESVYPEDVPQGVSETSSSSELPQGINGITPRFGIADLYRHLEESQALLFDFFEFEGSHFTTGIRVPQLLSRFGDEIWAQLEAEFEMAIDVCSEPVPVASVSHPDANHSGRDPAQFALVSTFRAGDSDFKSFIEKRLHLSIRQTASDRNCKPHYAALSSVYVNIRELPEGTDYMLFPHGSELDGRHVYLLLASVGASQTLQDLVALLAANEVSSITVIVLLNRMGLRTQNFVARIRKLVRGLSPRGTDDTSFEFIPVYSLTELGSRDIRAMEDAVGTLFRTYRERTQVPGFRNWIEQTRRYFEPHIVTGRDFRDDRLRKLSGPVDVNCRDYHRAGTSAQMTVPLTTLEAQLSCLCQKMVVDRDYDDLIALTGQLENKRDLYQVFALLLHGVGFLRRRHKFGQLRRTILSHILKLRYERLQQEQIYSDAPKVLHDRLEQSVELEAHLIFGLALFSYLDIQHNDYDKIIIDSLRSAGKVEQCLKTPLTFLLTFSNERWAWSLSMLLLLSRHHYGRELTPSSLRDQLVREVRDYKDLIRNRRDVLVSESPAYAAMAEIGAVRSLETLCRLSRDNLDSLLTDLGKHRLVRYDQIVRFLHSHLFQKPHHSPIVSTLSTLRTELDAELRPASGSGSQVPKPKSVKVTSTSLKRALEEASSTIGLLEQIANAAVDLFGFTPAERERVARFADPRTEDSLLADVQRLGKVLRTIRNDNTVSVAEFQAVTATLTRLEEDLFVDASPLREALRRYQVRLRDAVVEAMEYARDRFARTLRKKPDGKRLFKRYYRIFDRELRRWADLDQNHILVLVDPFLLRETLRNVFTNVRYAVEGMGLKPDKYAELVDVTWESFERRIDDDATPMIRLTVTCRGKRFKGQLPSTGHGTLHEQELALQKYSATLKLQTLPNAEKGIATIFEMIDRGTKTSN